MISALDYCSKICKAKCCYHTSGHRCLLLTKENTCSVYKERFKESEPDFKEMYLYQIGQSIKPLICGRIKKVIEKGGIPLPTLMQCCIQNPELLEKDYEIPIR